MNHIVKLENSNLRIRIKEESNRIDIFLEIANIITVKHSIGGLAKIIWQKNLVLVDSENETIVDIAEARKQ